MTLWVIDTSSVIQIKDSVPIAERKKVLTGLTALVQAEQLIYPPQVVEELGRYVDSKPEKRDELFIWARDHKQAACKEPPEDLVKEILADPMVRRVLDVEKVGVEEADVYVLALARHMSNENKDVVVVTELSLRQKAGRTAPHRRIVV